MNTQIPANKSPGQLLGEILHAIAHRYKGTDHERGWTKIYRLYEGWYIIIKDKRLPVQEARAVDARVVSLCESLENVYAIFPGVVVREEERNALISIMEAASELDRSREATAVHAQNVRDSLLELEERMSSLISASPVSRPSAEVRHG